jgi:hypothetical protein
MIHKLLLFLLLVFISSESLFAKKFALVIGTNYKGNKADISPLDLCEADAYYINEQISKVCSFDEVKTLIGRDVTKQNIEKEIKAIGAKAKPDDVVFLYFAGHGGFERDAKAKNGMRNYLLCYERPHLYDEELDTYLKSIKSEKTVFVVDACHSGGISKKGKATRGNKDVPIPDGKQGTVRQDTEDYFFQNKTVVASADDSETAIELGGTINHGIFTYYFGRAMEDGDLNGDKVTTVLEAFYKSKDQIIQKARENNHTQNPQISGNASGIYLKGENPTPPAPPVNPPTNPVVDVKPEPSFDPPKPDPVKPPVTPEEPPVVNPVSTGDLLIRTNIIKDRSYGLNSLDPSEILKWKKTRIGDRKLKVLVDDKEVNFTVTANKSDYWGSQSKAGRLIQGEVYSIVVKNLGAGVHKITVRADDYPEINSNFAITNSKENILDITACMSGVGAIEGQVFYKTLDNPVIKHPIYMPTLKSLNNNFKVLTDADGKFYFTNLVPGEYELKASFFENLDLNNAMIKVKEGEITKVQVILNVKLPLTKTKY